MQSEGYGDKERYMYRIKKVAVKTTTFGGEREIRTPGTLVRRFSRPVQSTTLPSLLE